ncbi:uncharacterized protein EURHEDRAFT_414102 [Aspergillus ruber CBS 135680]|uniref:Uncharacterized protein n=1 Tax=Aspergillus ruber (strain CBS 135680) TaxID=1388766 RepID=A0A017S9S8_ASPRC|nr:uncharacterized protein EURHEDRAFT_414102 [Aspergillus ruber CBS 135680]EYE93687.1 hypothetical protein EURHEDRAFT_414102 [Aspergillus ruber CBS 135680]
MATSRRSDPSRPLRSSRLKVQSYHEDSSSDDSPDGNGDGDSEEGELRRLSLSLRPRSSNRMPPSYREESSDDNFERNASDENVMEAPGTSPDPLPAPTSSNGTASRPRRDRTVKTRSQTRHSKRPMNNSRMDLGRPRSKRKKVEVDEIPLFTSGVIPPWQHLPYHILFDIFFYASRPLVDERSVTRTGSVQWLVQVALLCHAFCEPALAALYYSPPLIPAAKCHGLLSLLSQPQDSLSTNYTNKIKELHVDVEALLLYKSGPTLGYFELPRLIENTPQVKKMRLYHAEDYVVGIPPWQRARSKWGYPEGLFESIAYSAIRLRSWDWNCRFMETPELAPHALTKHLQPAFQGIEELRFLHVASEEWDEEGDAYISNEREVVLATALKELPELRQLVFIECSIVNEHLLPHLPTTLTSLTLNNCDEVTTANFGAFLTSHGQHLRELNLSHNRHLSMSFIVGLGGSCKNLKRFKMDISIHDWSSYHDVEPHFPELIRSSEVPTWPSTLQDIELIQLRRWDDAAAEVFFTSLINAAPELPNLRRLVISAILKIGWRDRATFREKWIGRLEHVFLRRSAPPDPNLRTLPRSPPPPDPVEGTAEDTAGPHSDTPNSGPSTPSKRKSARLAQRKIMELEDDDDDVEGSSSPSRTAAEGFGEQEPRAMQVQGMCDAVMVRIDNQRPTETQFSEGDFLDDEISGDEDWDGDDWDVAEGGYAW